MSITSFFIGISFGFSLGLGIDRVFKIILAMIRCEYCGRFMLKTVGLFKATDEKHPILVLCEEKKCCKECFTKYKERICKTIVERETDIAYPKENVCFYKEIPTWKYIFDSIKWEVEYVYYYIIRDFLRTIKRNIKILIQRYKYRVADDDLYEFHVSILEYLINGLEKYKKMIVGCPPEYFDENATGGKECGEYEQMINEMIEGFTIYRDYLNWEKSDLSEEEKEKIVRAFELLKQNIHTLWI